MSDSLIHPMLRVNRPLISTRSIERLANAIIVAVEQGHHGIKTIGVGQSGKSSGYLQLAATEKWRASHPMTIQFVRMSKTEKSSEGTFFSTWQYCMGLRVWERARGNSFMHRIANHLTELSDTEKTEIVAIALDEGQRMTNADYEHLVTLDNEMQARNKRLFILQVHQADVRQEKEAINEEGPSSHVVGRFMLSTHNFTGIDGVEEIQFALKQYDNIEVWPAGSGITFSNHFAPAAFARGWRLQDHAQQFLDAVLNLRGQNNLPLTGWTWRMKTFEAFVAYLLTSVAGKNVNFEGFSRENVAEALLQSSYAVLENLGKRP